MANGMVINPKALLKELDMLKKKDITKYKLFISNRANIVMLYHIELDDLDYTPFDSQGSRGKMHQLFGSEMSDIINELNEVLAA